VFTGVQQHPRLYLHNQSTTMADFESDSRGYDGKRFLFVASHLTLFSDDVRYDRGHDASRSPRGDMRGGGDSRARSASPNGHDRGDTR
jgi:hypothetical protein